MKIQAQTVEEFFAAAGEREPELRELDRWIGEEAPQLERQLAEGMAWRMLAYGMLPYQTKHMKEPGRWPLIALAPQKNYMSLYVCAVIDGQYVAERYAPTLGKVNVGKSCIRFKRLTDLDEAGARTMLRDVAARHEKGELLFG